MRWELRGLNIVVSFNSQSRTCEGLDAAAGVEELAGMEKSGNIVRLRVVALLIAYGHSSRDRDSKEGRQEDAMSEEAREHEESLYEQPQRRQDVKNRGGESCCEEKGCRYGKWGRPGERNRMALSWRRCERARWRVFDG